MDEQQQASVTPERSSDGAETIKSMEGMEGEVLVEEVSIDGMCGVY